MVAMPELLKASILVLVGRWFLGRHHPASAFQSPGNNHPRQKVSLQARKHILYTQQYAHQRISNSTTTLLNSEVHPPREDDNESSQKLKFHEHIRNMLNAETHQKVLMAYNELLGISKMYKKSKQPPRQWNKRSERIIKLRDMFEIDRETTSEVDTGELRWKGSVLQPSFDCYEEVANALISPVVFRKIGGWEVCRLLEQMLAEIDHQSSDDVQAVKECINSNLIEALSKVGDGPSARQILYREKIARVQKQKEAEKRMIEKEISPPQKGDVVVSCGANYTERIDEDSLITKQFENSIRHRELKRVAKDIAIHRNELGVEEEQPQIKDLRTGDDADGEFEQERQQVVPRASNALTYAKMIHNCYADSQHDKQAAPKSLKLLKQMVKSLDERPHQLEPDMWIFNTVLLIWARSGRPDSGQVAEEILQMMKVFGRNRSHSEFPYPNDQSFTFVIDAYANSGQKNSGQKALEMLHQLEESDWRPNARCLSTTIEAIFKAGDPIPLHLLKRMIALNQAGDDSSVINSRTFTKAIVRGDAENALQVLDLLDEFGNDSVGPNVVHYNAAIFCVAKSDSTNPTATADELLRAMEERGIKGNVVTYTAMLTAQDTYDGAERWLWRMEDNYGISPTTRTYNSCFRVLLNGDTEDATDRAFALLTRMETRYLNGNNDAKPDLVTYTAIANVLRKHGSQDIAESGRQADWLLSRVRQMGCKPDEIFDAAINYLRLGK